MFKKFDITKREFYFGVFLLITPFLFYTYEYIPDSNIITIFGVDFESKYNKNWQIVVYFFLSKFVPLSTFLIMFFFTKRKIVYFFIPLIGLYIFQLISLFLDELLVGDYVTGGYDEFDLDRWFVMPIAIISGSVLIIIRNVFARKEREKKREELLLKEKMISLKHQALNAQMNPHFINNLLLHIYVALEKGNQKNSLSDLGSFSQLVSLVLKSTKSSFISLEDELKITQYYLKLQQSRFEHQFEYLIKRNELNEEDIEYIKVPPMILQPIIENAIEHGIRSKDVNGKIELNLSETEDYLHCEISDNGIGYSQSKAMQNKYHSGISLKNIEERLQIMDAKTSSEKLVNIEDRVNINNKVIGTKVTLKVPLVA